MPNEHSIWPPCFLMAKARKGDKSRISEAGGTESWDAGCHKGPGVPHGELLRSAILLHAPIY